MTDILTKLLPLTAILYAGCASAPADSPASSSAPPGFDAETLVALESILSENDINTAQIGLMRGGELVASHVYGEVRPGVAADRDTRLNVASITKTVVADIALALIDAGVMSLDEPISNEWVDPDLEGDPNLDALTVERMLTHSSGLPNWRFFRADGKLTVQQDPGSGYTYSGEGFQMLARFMEARTGLTLEELARRYVFTPNGMHHTSIAVDPATFPTIAQEPDADGVFHGYFCRPPNQGGGCMEEGEANAAANMVTTVEDYARFLSAVYTDAPLPGAGIANPRTDIRTPFEGEDRVVYCETEAPCPDAQGYGLGYTVVDYGDRTYLGHGGWDWSQLDIAYIDSRSGDGAMVFLIAPNARASQAMPGLLEIIDPDSPYLPRYRRWAD